jgi:16S rRNA (cytidine1402-2'-O)-methyltransferase
MAALYVVGLPAVYADDLPLRAQRTLKEVTRIITEDLDAAQSLLAQLGIGTPLVEAGGIRSFQGLQASGDVAVLYSGRTIVPTGPAAQVIREATEAGATVVPIPGPTLPITALVLSGFPADTFVYLGELPAKSKALAGLLTPVTSESRTLLAQAALEEIGGILDGLLDLLGDRSVAIITAQEGEGLKAWRGTLEEAGALRESLPNTGSCSLVIGGARGEPEPWDEDRVRVQVEALLRQGLGIKEISQRLSAESGWARRDVYSLAVKVHKGS